MTEKKYLTTVENIIALMKEEIENISPLRLQKTLYFLFAYYGASYGQLYKSKEYEVSQNESLNLPEYLFDAKFEAWQYGPVIREVYMNNKHSLDYNDIDFSMSNFEIEDKTMQQEITEYLREIIRSTLKISDFGLVERSHEDEEWKNNITQQEVMKNDGIINEYIELVNA
ncbi:Panacea domain-containing protein [Staphylococcus simiae]|uniref:Antitoxin SocA-like Panacea domain-containing protein n=1 Tax=Staphylococcus simiae CCM 7213 = CCUG 51256 TaxID=911238 RepID=G5JLE3_9STAP|nr:type II toxin-antitoxin system antitoxin SocA domain-containing protein [Staphylococcus simiae]EHJ06984.1 hypothetical protein SS7213T_11545 [Staphylococcus simiae CCM 7213 = CCUG 51256]PNZ10955.1 DUF4065 domain-containing protein [Staphylococcus simiae]SNV60722.1 Uncharacterized phage-associated protein [Staphylococcus simiae]